MAYRVFISHSTADLWVASQIKRRFEELGIDTFIDAHDITKGDDIEDRIFEEMPACDEILVLLTPWSVDRNWVWTELGCARGLGIRIVAVLYQTTLDMIDREKGGSTFLRAKNCVDINDLDTYFEQVARRVSKRSPKKRKG